MRENGFLPRTARCAKSAHRRRSRIVEEARSKDRRYITRRGGGIGITLYYYPKCNAWSHLQQNTRAYTILLSLCVAQRDGNHFRDRDNSRPARGIPFLFRSYLRFYLSVFNSRGRATPMSRELVRDIRDHNEKSAMRQTYGAKHERNICVKRAQFFLPPLLSRGGTRAQLNALILNPPPPRLPARCARCP